MQNERFYLYNDKYTYDFIIRRKIDEKVITKRDAELLTGYIEHKLDNGQIEDRRAQRLATALTQWRKFLPEYSTLTYKTLLRGITGMKKGKSSTGRPYSQSTQRSMIKTIKTFTTYLRKEGIIPI